MLFSFKRPPLLSKLIPQGYVDIHSHLLPAIDDGAKSVAHSEQLLKGVQALGFEKIITTPHTMSNVWDNSSESINNAKLKLYNEIPETAKALDIQAASEYLMDETFRLRIHSDPLLCLKDKYVLVELSYLFPPMHVFDIVFELQTAGYTPVLAHPERYRFYHKDFDTYKQLKKAGCLFQLNLLSAVGYYGKSIAQCANKLLKAQLIDFTGSDIHHEKHIDAFEKPLVISEVKALEKAMKNNELFR